MLVLVSPSAERPSSKLAPSAALHQSTPLVIPPGKLILRVPRNPKTLKHDLPDFPDNHLLAGDDEASMPKVSGCESGDDELAVGEA